MATEKKKMFVVPEVDDDIDVSTPVNAKKPIPQPEATKESVPLSSSPPPLPPPLIPTAENVDKNSAKMQAPPVSAKQHRSRRSLFHRNTIHICDQIVDRV
jgi:hypothetical protein